MTSANLTQTSTARGPAVATAVLLTALVAGTIDIGAASLISGKPFRLNEVNLQIFYVVII